MAAHKITAVGSLAWLANERYTIKQLKEQDVEDIAYAVRNDMDWLNEHMANIFEKNILCAMHTQLLEERADVVGRLVIWWR